MPLPQQVINKLSEEPTKTPGWSAGLLLLCSTLLGFVIVIYIGITFIYEPILNGQLSTVEGNITTLSQTITSAQQNSLITLYSQTTNLQSVLARHIIFTQFLTWLQQYTLSDIYYTSFSYSSADQVTIVGIAPTEADINQQIAVFQNSPQVAHVTVSDVTVAAGSSSSGYQFNAILLMTPSLFVASAPTTAPVTSAGSTSTQP